MATNIVGPKINTAISVEQRDRIDELLSKAMGLVDVMGNANQRELADVSLPAVAWAARDMLVEVRQELDRGTVK